jgi:hypothetical protein
MNTKLLITVKTYPTLTTNYDESVCTAGITEDGKWIRINPVQFRKLEYSNRYKKYDWIEIDLIKNNSDFRSESYSPKSLNTEIKVTGHIDTKNRWSERKNYILKNVYIDLSELITNSKERLRMPSLAVFKPTKILNFKYTEYNNKEWNQDKLKKLQQTKLFENSIVPVQKIPYKFVYEFEDIKGKISRMMIEDWEIGALYWNSLVRKNGNVQDALKDVKNKYYDEFVFKKELYFFLGTTRLHHFKPNPFIIIGLFYPPL